MHNFETFSFENMNISTYLLERCYWEKAAAHSQCFKHSIFQTMSLSFKLTLRLYTSLTGFINIFEQTQSLIKSFSEVIKRRIILRKSILINEKSQKILYSVNYCYHL